MGDVQLYTAAGNRFAVLDGRALSEAEALRRARELNATIEAVQLELDGVLVCLAPRAGGACRMLVVNRDGSRPEACGNGLRCLARFAVERGLASDELVIETDAGARPVSVERRRGGEILEVRTGMGVPRVFTLAEELTVEGAKHEVAVVDVGNPHCVLLVDDIERAPVAELGRVLEHHPRFPQRTNVGFVEVRGHALAVRVWERGVGETAACGTGASAAAAVALRRGLVTSPLDVRLPGGVLSVTWDGVGELFLNGPVEAVPSVRAEG